MLSPGIDLSLASSPPSASSELLGTLEIAGISLVDCSAEQALGFLCRRIRENRMTQVAFVNAHVVETMRRMPAYRALLANTVNFNDGVGIALAARLRGRRLRANLNGTDFCPRLLSEAARQGWPVFIYGARPDSLARALQSARTVFPGIRIEGHAGYGSEPGAEIAHEIRRFKARIVLVALGVPEQDAWLREHLAATGSTVGLGVGAFVDFLGGSVRRAPVLWRKARMEWCWRLLQEPRRLGPRYLLGGPRFLWWAWRNRRI
ncbi:MAG: WecB/TagA/CpsF family glycosyltransferase [Thermaerobacter sp.]|nr:WecB/TagA/CpsF family glycosyltransferase [Thermaerobacter sp.]